MNSDLVEIFSAPSKDPQFPKKYVITVAASALSFLLLPAVILVGYFAETIKHVSLGKKDLPEWKDFVALAVQGGASILTGLYLLPAAILFAISVVTAGSSGATVLGVSMLTAFISIGGLAIGFVGLAVATTAIHTYMHSDSFMDLFHLPNILRKIKEQAGPIGYLFGSVGLVTLGFSILSTYLGWFGSFVSLLSSAFLALALAYGVGKIYGPPKNESEALPAVDDSPKALPVTAETVWDPSDEQDDSDVWMPK